MNSYQSDEYDSVKSELLAILPRLHRYARRITVSAADAEDLLQSTSERVLSRWQQFRPGSDFDRWAFTIMQSIRKNNLRSEAVRLGHGHEDAAQTLAAPESQSPERNKINQQVFDSLQRLPSAQREVMLLVYVEGFSYSAAAEILDTPVGTIMSRIGRARIRLAAELNATSGKPVSSATGNAVAKPSVRSTLLRTTRPASAGSQNEGSLHTVFKR